ncbi:MAG: DUF2911 domain-containing protein [Bacteroidota bacterium]
MKNFSIGTIILGLMMAYQSQAQINMPAPSPLSKVTQQVGLMEASIEYSRPGVKGRKVFGDLVPFDKMWRTGANSPTKLTFGDKVVIEGKEIAAGTYSLMTMPGQSEWTIILNKDSKNRGVFDYNQSEDVIRFKAKSRSLNDMVESFSIGFTDLTMNSAHLEIAWEKTAVKFAFTTEVDSKVTAQIKQYLSPEKDAGPFYSIASYYYNQGTNMDQALELITKSVDMRPRYWSMHMKAKIQAKMKDKKGALVSAQKSMEMAQEADNQDYVRLNEKLMAELQ